MNLVEEFTDEGYSGARLDRPALDRLRDLAQCGRFEILLTYCADRLARKFVLQALIVEELERFGVKTVFLEGGAADDPLSKLMHQITGAVAEFERTKITERYRRGKLYRARCGEIVSSHVPFGYMRIPRTDGVGAHAEIEESEAAVVRRIFDAYVRRGVTVRQIAKELTLDRVPTPSDAGQWNPATVDFILHNESYIGTSYYNRKQCVPVEGAYGQKGQRYRSSLRPKEEWIPISVPPIIDLRTFQSAASRGKDNQAFASRNLQQTAYLLRRLVRCGRCGCSCSAIRARYTSGGQTHYSNYYRCWRKTRGFLKQERCPQRAIRADVLDEMVWEEVSTRLQDPELILQGYQEYKNHRLVNHNPHEQSEKLETQIKSANVELSRLLDAYQTGAVSLPELQKRRRLIDSKMETLNREKQLLERTAKEQKTEADIKDNLNEFASLIRRNLKHISFENKQKLLRMVLDKVMVKDWRGEVDYKIPLPEPTPKQEPKVSTKLDLCLTRSYGVVIQRNAKYGSGQIVGGNHEHRTIGAGEDLQRHIITSKDRARLRAMTADDDKIMVAVERFCQNSPGRSAGPTDADLNRHVQRAQR